MILLSIIYSIGNDVVYPSYACNIIVLAFVEIFTVLSKSLTRIPFQSIFTSHPSTQNSVTIFS